MKQVFTMIASVLLAMTISTSAFAHSHLGGSNPGDGDVITEPLNEIVLEFDGQIEQGSFIEVTTTEGQAVKIQELIVGEDTLTGTLAEPLPNDEYQVNWSIISGDGHPLEGEFSFTVDAEVPEVVEEEVEEPLEGEEATQSEETTEAAQESSENQESTISADDEEQGSSFMTVVLIVLIVVIVIGAFFLFRKKGK